MNTPLQAGDRMTAEPSQTIVIVNVHAALDRIFFIDRFEPDTHMRARKSLECVGGKGLDTAVVLRTLGAPLCAVTFIAGKNGQRLAELLSEKGITTELLWLEGETRVANVIVETENQCHSHITTIGYRVSQEDCNRLLETVRRMSRSATWGILSGSLPPGAPQTLYCEITQALHDQGVRVLIDSLGTPLLETLSENPEIVKMNRAEFTETFGRDAGRLKDWVEPVHQVMAEYKLNTFVLTGGKEGILAATPQGDFLAGCQVDQEVNAAGAGDAVSAAVVHRLMENDTWEQALTWAAATSAAVVQTEGTAECELPEIRKLLPRAWVKKI